MEKYKNLISPDVHESVKISLIAFVVVASTSFVLGLLELISINDGVGIAIGSCISMCSISTWAGMKLDKAMNERRKERENEKI